MDVTALIQPDGKYRLGDFLVEGFKSSSWTHFRASVAFAKKSGTNYIRADLSKFSTSRSATISVGIDHGGTSAEALEDLVASVSPSGRVWVYKNNANTFHPKVFLFRNAKEADLVVGSGNLTKGGLFENYEANIRFRLNLGKPEDIGFLAAIEAGLDAWSKATPNLCIELDAAVIAALKAAGQLPTEAQANAAIAAASKSVKASSVPGSSPFKSYPIQAAPALIASISATPAAAYSTPTVAPVSVTAPGPAPASASGAAVASTFGMTLQNTDVGVGQTTSGTQKRSPEVFIPLLAVDSNPSFWGWSAIHVPDPTRYQADTKWRAKNASWIAAEKAKPKRIPRPLDKLDWFNVMLQLAGHAGNLTATFWFNPRKKDLRIRESTVRGAGAVGDILLVKPAPAGSIHHYDLEVIPKAQPAYGAYLAKLTKSVPNSKKKFGYF